MADEKGSTDYWRKIFNSAKGSIFELIDKAILIASMDSPEEFNERRNLIVEKLYTSHLSLNNGDHDPKEEKNSSNYEADASHIIGEVMRIKEFLSNNQYESDSVLYESLRTLQLMQISVETLKATEIGRTVNALRKHNSNQVRFLVRILIDDWEVKVVEWMKSNATITKNVEVDHGVSCSSKQTCEKEPRSHLSGKKRKSDEVSDMFRLGNVKRKLHEGYQRIENDEDDSLNKPNKSSFAAIIKNVEDDSVNKPNKSSVIDPRLGCSSKQTSEEKPNSQLSGMKRKYDKVSDELDVEISMQKLRERNQQIKNERKQRRIQIIELCDIPPMKSNEKPQSRKKSRN